MSEIQICPLYKNTLDMSFRVIANGSYMQVQNTCICCGWSIIRRATRLTRSVTSKPNKNKRLKQRPKTRYGVVVNNEESIKSYCVPYKETIHITCRIIGELKNGRKLWAECNYETLELISPERKYLLVTGKIYPSNNIFIPYKGDEK